MNFKERERLDSRIQRVFEQIARVQEHQDVCAELSRYAAVLTSGLLEAACRDIVGLFVQSRSHQHVANYVRQEIAWFQNPKMDKILTLVGAFSAERRKQLEDSIDDSLKDAVDSIVTTKNNIAHGRDTQITPVRVRDYFARCSKVIALIEKAFAA